MKSSQYPAQDLRRRTGVGDQAEGESPRGSGAGDAQEVGSCSSAGTVTLATDFARPG